MWNEDQDRMLIELWNAGGKASAIAKAVGGKSRCAVLGRLHRLRDKGVEVRQYVRVPRPIRERKPRAQYGAASPRPRQTLSRPIPIRRPLERLPSSAVVLKRGEVEPNGTPVGLIELCAAACRWPVSNSSPHVFCNKIRCGGSSYCEEHVLRSYAVRATPQAVDSADSLKRISH